ncbi:MAG TPA: GspH/FimT family protein [Methylophilaceae bacterium]|nr:GspH/FimT family protein [Methylophilaceae bacterium]
MLKPCQAGFTLIELMVSITIVAIIATIAVPSFTEFSASQRVKAAASNLFISILQARSEAIKRDATVTLSPIDGDWAKGWIMQNPAFPDLNLARHDQSGRVTISGPASLSYRSSGRLADTSITGFSISADGTSSQRCVTVSLDGQPMNKTGACS